MLASELLPLVERYLKTAAVAAALGHAQGAGWTLQFLAQGEYNINYLLTSADGQRLVVRVNNGTQIGQAGGAQIAYEAAALRLLGPHGIAPRLIYVDDRLDAFPYGLLVMEYLPGGVLQYDDPWQIAAAAQTLARLHQVPAPDDGPFIRRRALVDDLAEGQDWLGPYLGCERAPEPVRACFATILARAAEDSERFADRFPKPFALVHTDVQAHNFLVNTGVAADAPSCYLVDWERPLVDDPTYDLAHFLIPTTTRWKCGYTFTEAQADFFLAEYCRARPDLDEADIRERLRLRYPFILLRAVSWCAGAWVEYTGQGRAIANEDTLLRIEEYLQPAYLAALFPAWLGDS